MDINIVKLKKYAEGFSVLYVEDDELIRTQTHSFLGRFFSDIVIAENGQAGLDEFKKRDFDVVISDINMPIMNGIEMIRSIRELKYEQIVLVTSAYNDSNYLMEIINLNVMRFIQKPFNNKQFLYIIYKIAEELNFKKEKQELESKIQQVSKRSQIIVDQINIGILVISNNNVDMANKAFLDIGGFDTFDTLKLEMPDIGVLFEEASHCITATTNEDLINQLNTLEEEDRKVKITVDSKMIEYQVGMTPIDGEDNSYILTFNDITAIHNSLFLDQFTKLPTRRFILEKIELIQKNLSVIDTIIISMKSFNNIEKWYGKTASRDAEIDLSENIKACVEEFMPDAFIGYFEKNQFIVIMDSQKKLSVFENALKQIEPFSLDLYKKHNSSDVDFHLSVKVKQHQIHSDKDLAQIESELINEFDFLV